MARLRGKFTPIKSFGLKKKLNEKFWSKDMSLDREVRGNLIQISTDLVDGLDMKIEIEDIIFTGSLANYNWSKYSDIDLHILVDYLEINKDYDLVQKYLESVKKIWNTNHDIIIKGYPVEVYFQDVSEEHSSSGQFSVLKDKWLVKPQLGSFKPDEQLIKKKSIGYIKEIDELEMDIESGDTWDDIEDRFVKLWKKIKQSRKKSLEKDGEFSIENLIFKLLRRNGYIEKLINLKTKAYDDQYTIK